jgi:hypothetical protein
MIIVGLYEAPIANASQQRHGGHFLQSFTLLDQLFTSKPVKKCSYWTGIPATEIQGGQMQRDWESAYREAVLETDPGRIIGKIDMARVAVAASLSELETLGEHEIERQRLIDALSTLELIRRVELKISA